jgi:hypothetical protein
MLESAWRGQEQGGRVSNRRDSTDTRRTIPDIYSTFRLALMEKTP